MRQIKVWLKAQPPELKGTGQRPTTDRRELRPLLLNRIDRDLCCPPIKRTVGAGSAGEKERSSHKRMRKRVNIITDEGKGEGERKMRKGKHKGEVGVARENKRGELDNIATSGCDGRRARANILR